ncbi:MAG: DUF2807 domain-containing protein [candidate division Zixibacteria bacterium]|nr:DUF2807 domain-containing protein [candidate division Zixibacteria bacterium]MDH3937342.1 DUF2807 domain-containing protein [candidate division Zixibacteria bacterium]
MVQRLSALVLLVPLLFLLSCGSTELPLTYNSIRGSGNLITVLVEDLDLFHSVTLKTTGDVMLVFDTEPAVAVSVDHNLQRFITTEVVNDVLMIGLKTPKEVKVSGMKLTVWVTMPVLQQLTLDVDGIGSFQTDSSLFQVPEVDLVLAGVGNMELDLEVSQRLSSTLTGVGNLVLTGSARRHDLTHEATGGVHAFEFETDSCTIISNSVGDIEVDVREYLNATISNIGSIYYHGFPAIEVVDTGLGELIDDN